MESSVGSSRSVGARPHPRSLDFDDSARDAAGGAGQRQGQGPLRSPLLERDAYLYGVIGALIGDAEGTVDFGDVHPVRDDRLDIDFTRTN